jgi:hypothetical protein
LISFSFFLYFSFLFPFVIHAPLLITVSQISGYQVYFRVQ